MRYPRRILTSGIALSTAACFGTEAQAGNQGNRSPYLLRATSQATDTTGLDLRLCALFDGSSSGLGREWEDVVWFELDGIRIEDHQPRKDYRPDPPEVGACAASLRYRFRRRSWPCLSPLSEL